MGVGSRPTGNERRHLSLHTSGRSAALGVAVAGRLRRWNLVAGLLLAAEGAAMLALSNDLSLPVSAAFLRIDPVRAQQPVSPETLFRLPIGPTVAVFLLLAALDHLLVASPALRPAYERRLARGQSPFRWVEYSVSAAIMMVLIAAFVGIRDVAALAGVFAATSAMILFGLLMERQQTPGSADWSAFAFGSLVGAVPWVLVFVYVAEAGPVPGFVWAITVTQLLLFAGFAVNMALQYLRVGPFRDFLFGERSYVALSLVAKSLLAWLIYANVLRT